MLVVLLYWGCLICKVCAEVVFVVASEACGCADLYSSALKLRIDL